MSEGNGNGNGGHGPSAARVRLDELIAEADDDRMTKLARTLTDGLDRLERQSDRALEKFTGLVERQTASAVEMIKGLADRVIALEAEVARLKAQEQSERGALQ